MRTGVAAVVPVIDERAAIGEVVAGLRSAGACCVLVVDGGFTGRHPRRSRRSWRGDRR